MTLYAVYVEGQDGAFEFFGPFRDYDKAQEVWEEINDADGGHCEINATIGPLERPLRSRVKRWLREEDDIEMDDD